MEKLQNRPEFAQALGIEVRSEIAPPGAENRSDCGRLKEERR